MECLIIQMEENQLVVAHFEITRRKSEMIGGAVLPLDDTFRVVEALSSIASKINGSPRVILCLPTLFFAQRTVSLPLKELKKVREVLPAQLGGEIALPLDDLLLDAMPTAAENGFLALWIRKAQVLSAVELLREAGIEPRVVTAAPFAFAELPGVPEECAVSDGRTLALIKGGRLSYFRSFDGEATPEMIASALSALELSGTPLPSRLSLVGAAVHNDYEQGQLSLPTAPLEMPSELGALFKNEDNFYRMVPLYAVAKGYVSGRLPDFRQGELSWKEEDPRLRKKLLITGCLLAVVLILLFVSKGLEYRRASSDLASVNRSIAGLYREMFPSRSRAVDEIAEVKGEIRKLSGIANTSRYLEILRKLSEAKGAHINGLYEAELEGDAFRLKGDAASTGGIADFRSALMPHLVSVEAGETKSRPDGTVGFSISGVFKGVAR